MVVDKGGRFWQCSYSLFVLICKVALIILTALDRGFSRSCGVSLQSVMYVTISVGNIVLLSLDHFCD